MPKGSPTTDTHTIIVNTINQLTNRHIAKVLTQLDEIGTSSIIKGAVKREFWRLSDDIKSAIEVTRGNA